MRQRTRNDKRKTRARKRHSAAAAGGNSKRHLDGLAAVLSVAAHPVRLQILESLLGGVKCVKDLNELIPISQPNLSQHMAALRRAGLTESESRGALRCYYVLRPALVERLLGLKGDLREDRRRSRRSVLKELDSAAGCSRRKREVS